MTNDPELERARQLFQRGLQLAERHNFSAAAEAFSEALSIRSAPPVEYNLAAALYELHQYDEAYNRCQSVLANETTPEPVRERARQLEASLHTQVARLTVITSASQTDLGIQVDGVPLDPVLVGRPQAVPAGKHEVVASRAETTLSRREIDIPVGTAALVDVSVVVTDLQQATQIQVSTVRDSAPPPALTVDSSQRDDEDHARRKRRRWIGIAAGVVAAGIGATLAIILSKPAETHQEPLQGDTGVLTW
ncbi:MAG: hypothetical protein QM778_12325 [Myxococcales bacterium]